jgi:hypothetical protein
MRATNEDFDKDCVVGHMSALDHDLQIRQRVHQVVIEASDCIPAAVMFAPGFVIVLGSGAEGPENAFEIVRIFKRNMLLN